MLERVIKDFEKKHYKLHKHTGVQICEWNKKSLRGQGVCYKEKFYGVNCHRCMQFSPSVFFCSLRCSFCWCNNELYLPEFPKEFLKPEEIVDPLIEKRKKLLSGFGGSIKDKEKLREAMEPNHFAVSLSGEPTLYPEIAKLVSYVSQRARTVFLVTNGTNPERLKQLEPKENFQLYLSLNAPNEKIFTQVCKPLKDDAWKKINESLDVIREFKGRRVIRMTLIKGLNDSLDLIPEYVKLIEKGNPDFVEVKAFMSIGESKKRLGHSRMPSFEEVKEFGLELSKYINYNFEDEAPCSRIVLLKNRNSKAKNKFD